MGSDPHGLKEIEINTSIMRPEVDIMEQKGSFAIVCLMDELRLLGYRNMRGLKSFSSYEGEAGYA